MSRVDIQSKKAFTLFELIIVMTIIGVIYTLLIQNFTFNDDIEDTVSIKTIPDFLRKKYGQNQSTVKLRCLDECSTCKIFEDDKEEDLSIELFEKRANVNAYTLIKNELVQIEFRDYFIDEYDSKKVCFEYTLYPNGSSDKIILEYKDKVYLFDNYKKKTKVFDRVNDASDFWIQRKNIVQKG